MIVRNVDDIVGTERDVRAPTFESRRLLLKRDNMGCSVHDTILHEGTETEIWYKHHLESVYCLEGEAEIEMVPSGEIHRITPGTLYALDEHDKHILRVVRRFRALCVFVPPLTGEEVHDEEGTYPLIDDTGVESGGE